jgi:hypothetical protein
MSGIQRRLVESIGSRSESSAKHPTFVDHLSRQRLVFENTNPFAGTEHFRVARFQKMPDFDLTFLIQHQRGRILILDLDIEDGSTNGDDSRGGPDLIVIRKPAEVLDLNSDLAQPDFKQVFPITSIRTKNDMRIRENLELASVGNLEHTVTIGPRYDDLLGLNQIARLQSPGCGIPHD